jgi:hypothetical protein
MSNKVTHNRIKIVCQEFFNGDTDVGSCFLAADLRRHTQIKRAIYLLSLSMCEARVYPCPNLAADLRGLTRISFL